MTSRDLPPGGGHASLVPQSHEPDSFQPAAYRDPWLSQGWFARLVADSDSEPAPPRRLNDFRSAGNRLAILAILALQGVLSARFIGTATGTPTEGLSLWAGYLQVHHLITLGQLRGLMAGFPGSPEVYPQAGALAAAAGGLSGARQLSLGLMLFATCMQYGVTRRLWSARTPAIFSAALFAGLGSVQFLGVLATSDAMGLALLALAVWLAVRAAPCPVPGRLGLLAAAAACLIVANAVLYATIYYDPIVIVVAALAARRARRAIVGAGTFLALTVLTAALGAGAYEAAGSQYRAAIRSALRVSETGSVTALHVATSSGEWLAILLIAALGAAIAATWRHRSPATFLLTLVMTAALAAPALATREYSTASLYPQAALGAFFACAVAGWGLALLFDAGKKAGQPEAAKPARLAGRGAAFIALLASAAIGLLATTTQVHDWPGSTAAASRLATLATANGEYLAEDYGQFAYDERTRITLAQWADTTSYSYLDPVTKHQLTGPAAYAAAIRDRYFSVIVLDGLGTPATDQDIEQDIAKLRDYRRVASIPFTTSSGAGSYVFWVPDLQLRPADAIGHWVVHGGTLEYWSGLPGGSQYDA
jgi:hypothetical protein